MSKTNRTESWTVYIITDTGRHVAHWSDTTRAKCRAIRAEFEPGVRSYVARAHSMDHMVLPPEAWTI